MTETGRGVAGRGDAGRGDAGRGDARYVLRPVGRVESPLTDPSLAPRVTRARLTPGWCWILTWRQRSPGSRRAPRLSR
jgi:hypothetical protein